MTVKFTILSCVFGVCVALYLVKICSHYPVDELTKDEKIRLRGLYEGFKQEMLSKYYSEITDAVKASSEYENLADVEVPEALTDYRRGAMRLNGVECDYTMIMLRKPSNYLPIKVYPVMYLESRDHRLRYVMNSDGSIYKTVSAPFDLEGRMENGPALKGNVGTGQALN